MIKEEEKARLEKARKEEEVSLEKIKQEKVRLKKIKEEEELAKAKLEEVRELEKETKGELEKLYEEEEKPTKLKIDEFKNKLIQELNYSKSESSLEWLSDFDQKQLDAMQKYLNRKATLEEGYFDIVAAHSLLCKINHKYGSLVKASTDEGGGTEMSEITEKLKIKQKPKV